MTQVLPGTVLEADLHEENCVEKLIGPMFLTGGLVLSQVAQISGLEPYMIQNWVRRGFLAPPVGKKYTRRQLSRILIINMLKNLMQMERICALLSYINNRLDDESDDGVDDSDLYAYMVRLIALLPDTGEVGDAALDTVLVDYSEPFAGARRRLEKVLRILVGLWRAEELRAQAEREISELQLEEKEKEGEKKL